MASYVFIHSDADSRGCTIFPPVDGEGSAVDCMPVDKVCRCTECHCDEEYGCWVETVTGYTLADIPYQFRRLGSKSRMQVMALYRAIVERFEIMRATGECGVRPDPFSFCGSGYFGGIDSVCKRREIAQNPRRVFGGTFRDAFRGVLSRLTASNMPGEYCGVVFYPPTPSRRGCVSGATESTFTKCATHASFCWKGMMCSIDYEPLLGDWTHDLTQRVASPRFGDGMAGVCRRPLLRDIAKAYAETCMPCADKFCNCVECKLEESLDVAMEPTGAFGDVFGRGDSVAPLPYVCVSGSIEAGPRFNMFALGLAMRILSVINAQTVKRQPEISIPHVKITAKRRLDFLICGDCVRVCDEVTCFTCSVVECSVATARVVTRYADGKGHFNGKTWYDSAYRQNCGPGWVCDCVPRSCWEHWEHHTYSTCCVSSATAEMTAIWPCVRHTGESHSGSYATMSGVKYPSTWALAECDVGLAAVTILARSLYCGDCVCKRGAVLRAVESSRSQLKSKATKDVMEWLAGLGVDAALWRVVCDIQEDIGTCADAVGKGLSFPISCSDAFGDLGCVPCVCDIRPKPDQGRWTLGTIHLCSDPELGYRQPKYNNGDEWVNVCTRCNGRFWALEGRDVGASHRYDMGCYHSWGTGRERVNFGGFFGTFGFHNTADLQA